MVLRRAPRGRLDARGGVHEQGDQLDLRSRWSRRSGSTSTSRTAAASRRSSASPPPTGRRRPITLTCGSPPTGSPATCTPTGSRATAEEISVDVTLTGDVPPWRPETGFMLFGPERDKEFAWLPSVPQGTVEATYRIGDESIPQHRSRLPRPQLGQRTAPASSCTTGTGRGGRPVLFGDRVHDHLAREVRLHAAAPIVMLARDGAIIADDSRAVRFERDGVYTDEVTGKPVANVTRYIYEAGDVGDERYVITFTRRQDLTRDQMIEGVHGPQAGPRQAGQVRRRLPAVHRRRPGRALARRHDDRSVRGQGNLGTHVLRARQVSALAGHGPAAEHPAPG